MDKKQVKKTGKSQDRKPRSVSKSAEKNKAKADAKNSKSKSKAKDKKAKSEANKENKKKQSKSKSKSKESKSKKGGKKGEIEEAKADEKKPQRAISAYIYYSNDQIPKIKQEKGVSHKEAMSIAGAKWKELSDKEKKPYEDMHDKDQKRHDEQVKELKEKGYYTLEDGTKSTDLPQTGKKKKSKSDGKTGGKRQSSVGKKKEKAGAKSEKKGGKKGKKEEEESEGLDIESGNEASEVEESD